MAIPIPIWLYWVIHVKTKLLNSAECDIIINQFKKIELQLIHHQTNP